MHTYKIGNRQLYILPTKIGWYFVMILLALFAIAIKFNNNPAFMMLFMLISIGIVGMHYTHSNMIGMTINTQSAKNIFCGEHAIFPVTLENNKNKPRHALWLTSGGFNQLCNLNENQHKHFGLKQPSIQRGYLTCSDIVLTSQFPIGLFFCWSKRYKANQKCLVYPQPLDLIEMPEDGSESGKQQQKSSIKLDTGDYAGMKSYQPGDRIRDIHWPSLAKSQKLITIQHEVRSNSSVNLSWFLLPNSMSVEDRLSQLCYWLLEAEKNNTQYQLEMPNHTIEYARGKSHLNECLTVLALWGAPEYKNASNSNA